MALDAIAEVVIKTLGRLLVGVVFAKMFYWPGWLILRGVTVGRYPPKKPVRHSEEFVGALGFAVILVCVLFTVPGGAV